MSDMLSNRRIARTLVALLTFTLIQTITAIQAPYSYAAAGNVGPATASGTCSAAVGETTYVTATFVNNAFCLLQFTTGTTWTVPIGVNAIDILVVGGGGGGGSDGGGGGGGGEVRTATGVGVSGNATITTTVGTGGQGGSWVNSRSLGVAGSSSSAVVGATTYSAGGGSGGVAWQSTSNNAARGTGGSGGTALTGGTNYSMGGTNAVGTPSQGGTGFDGISTSFTGTSMYFAGGGGGGQCTNTKSDATFGGLAGGQGGGGRGSRHTQNVGSDAGVQGTDALGGGGGAGSACNGGGIDGTNARMDGGRGGNGVVYIKYVPVPTVSINPANVTAAIGSTATFSAATQGTIAGATRSVKWQVLVPAGSWTDISGATSDTYVTPTVTRSMLNNQYRYVTTDSVGTTSSTTYSSTATLSLATPYQGETDTALGPGSANKNYGSLNLAGTEIVKPASSDPFTVEAWVQPTDTCTANSCAILGREENYVIYFEAGELRILLWETSAWGTARNTGVNIPLNQWSHIAWTKSSTTWNLYVNGALVYTASLTYSPKASSTYLFHIGNRNGGSYPFKGYIDEVKMWRATRSASEVVTDMTRTVTNDTNLYAYWNFNEGTGATAYNQVPAASADTDLTMYATDLWNQDSISTKAQSGPYTVTTFKRSILNLVGGWKSPSGISKVSVLLVAGGGGGGGGLNGGGGGAGGFIETTTSLTQSSYYQIYVGAGGVGSQTQTYAATAPSNGKNSTALTLSATGGGYGGSEYYSPNTHYAPASGGSGGGASWGGTVGNRSGATGTSGQGNKGGDNASNCCYGAGGGGAGAVGVNTTSSGPGAGGAGTLSVITGTTLAGGGGGSNRGPSNNTVGAGAAGGAGGGGAGSSSGSAKPNTTDGAQSGTANTGGGGGAGVIAGGNSDGRGAQGGTGVVVIRWITGSTPSYTKPTNAYLNVGMTETFTTNVAQDSATAMLTRTFKWESTTPAANGTYSLIKQGTGAANAAFSWVPPDTGTSGSGYLYRLTVSDSDTLGLSITDSSTAYAVINRALVVSGNTTIAKRINLSKNETFTITLGTSTYRPVLSPVIPGITLDTSTAGSAIIKISETMTVGTYYETLTVTDSVSATIVTPLTIVVAAPPNLVNTSEIVNDGIIFNLDFANSASFDRSTKIARDISGSNKPITLHNSPTFSDENLGHLDFISTSSQYLSATGFTTMSKWSIDTFFRLDSTTKYTCIVTGEGASSTSTRNLGLCVDVNTARIYAGFWDGVSWTYVRTLESIPLNTWTHVVAEWDGLTSAADTSVKIWINGVAGTVYQHFTRSTSAVAASSDRIFINHSPTTSGSDYTDLSLGYLRIYNRALSSAEVTQNYNATKNRFLTANIDQATPGHKYGNSTTETYTITSGYGSDTISYAVGNKAGVKLETTTALVTLKMQESLTATTHYETITVTDSLGASTFLPIKMTVTKADTLTISLDTGTVVTFNNAPITSYPKPVIRGLAGLDTFTVTTKFSSSLYTKSATVPTNADTYTVIAEDPVFGLGALSNYVNVVYETSTAVVKKAKQPALSVFLYGGMVGQAFPISVLGGGGDGAISETVTAGGTMTGCTISNHSLSASSTSQGFCRVYIVKAASQNYLSESITADMYFMAYVNNQPTGQVGSGATIALNGVTSFDTSTVQAPSITGLSTTSISLTGGGTLTITGTGFTGTITVKFWRNKTISKTSGDSTTISVTATELSSIGATSGRIAVITTNGEGVSIQSLTITP